MTDVAGPSRRDASQDASERLRACCQCRVAKPASEFYAARRKPTGLRPACKACEAEARRRRAQLPGARDRLLIQARALYAGRDRDKNLKRWREYNRRPEVSARRRNRDPFREAARKKLQNAVAAGTVIKPTACQRCSAVTLLHGHHHDYSKPLDVEWLCPVCHGAVHRREVSV